MTGSSTSPCGSLLITGLKLDFVLLKTTIWTWLLSQFWINFTIYSHRSYFIDFFMKVVCETASKASLKYRQKISTDRPSFTSWPYFSARSRVCLCLHCSWGLRLSTFLSVWEDPVYLFLSHPPWCCAACWLSPVTTQIGNMACQQQHTSWRQDHLSQPQQEAAGTICSLGLGGRHLPLKALSGSKPLFWLGELLQHLLENALRGTLQLYMRMFTLVWTEMRTPALYSAVPTSVQMLYLWTAL